MKDKNNKEIYVGSKCLVDNKLGIVTEVRDTTVAVLMLNDGGHTCSEIEKEPSDIEIR